MNLKGVIGIMLLFILGVFVGAAGTMYFEKCRMEHAFRGPRELSFFMVNRISRELHLSPSQREKLIEVFKTARQKLHTIRLEAAPQVETVFAESENSIKSFLDEKQKTAFDHMIERRKHFFDKMRQEKPD